MKITLTTSQMKILHHQQYKCYQNQKDNCFINVAILVFAILFQLLFITEKKLLEHYESSFQVRTRLYKIKWHILWLLTKSCPKFMPSTHAKLHLNQMLSCLNLSYNLSKVTLILICLRFFCLNFSLLHAVNSSCQELIFNQVSCS